MVLRVLCLCALAFTVAHAGSVTNSDGLQLYWNVTSSTVTFTIVMPASLSGGYDYWGIGFKTSGSGTDMVQSNLWIITKAGAFYDVYSSRNDLPSLSAKGTAKLASHVAASSTYTSVITRNLAAASSSEQGFTEGASYLITYAYGTMTNSIPNEHSKSGGVSIQLTNSYVSTSSSNTAAPAAVGLDGDRRLLLTGSPLRSPKRYFVPEPARAV